MTTHKITYKGIEFTITLSKTQTTPPWTIASITATVGDKPLVSTAPLANDQVDQTLLEMLCKYALVDNGMLHLTI
jgi:hypothetical protein